MWSKVRSSAGGETGRLAGRSAYLLAFRVAGALTVYATQVVLARQLGKEALGRYASSMSVLLVLTEVALLGLPSAAMRFVGGAGLDADDGSARGLLLGYLRRGRQTVALTSLALAGVGMGIVAAALPAGSPSRGVLLAALAGLPAMAWLRLHGGYALARSWLTVHGLPNNVARPVLFLGALVALFALRPGTTVGEAMVLHVVVMVGVATAAACVVGRRVRALAGDAGARYETRLWLTTGAPLLFVSLATGYVPDVAVIAVRSVLSPADVAVFAVTLRTAFFFALAGIAVDSASLPRFAGAWRHGDRAQLEREVVRATRVKLVAGLAGLAVIALFGRAILALFGEGFGEGYASMLVLGAAFVVPPALGPGAALLGVTGHERTSQRAALANLIAVPALITALSPILGVIGAAWAVLGANVALAVFLRRQVVRKLGIEPSALGKG